MAQEQTKMAESPVSPSPMNFPPVFDLYYYRSANAGLTNYSDDKLKTDFELYGKSEGRAGSPQAFREHFLPLISLGADTLEIGPYCRPQLRGHKVRYFDIADREGLIEQATRLHHQFTEVPIIDYVSPTGDLDVIGDQFDQVFSSHCVEHQPDLVRHFSQVSQILRDGGSYFLIVPDKRFCFDHFLAETTIADVLGAHIEQRHLHYPKSVLEHCLLTTHNDSLMHWQGDHGTPVVHGQSIEGVRAAVDHLIKKAGVYINTHAWHFTPRSFEDISTQLFRLGLIRLEVNRVYNTPRGRCEFCAILSKH